jgi:glycosyltransferase involved in cell wall biosynthesis
MRILILSQYYHPEPVPKPHELAVALAERGHQVQVLTGYPNYPSGRIDPRYRMRPWSRESVDGVDIVRVPVFADHSTRAVFRVLNYVSFAISAALLGPLLVRKADVLYVFHPPLTIGCSAFVIGRLRRIPILYAVHDLWPEMVESSGLLTNARVLGWIGRLERWVYSMAHRLIAITEGFRQNMIGKGVPAEKIEMIPHWADETNFYPEERDPELARELGMDNGFNVLFAGNLGRVQAIDTVLDAAALLRDEKEVRIVLMGNGLERERLERRAREERLENVRFLPPQSMARMAKISALADAMLVTLTGSKSLSLAVPSKLISSFACGRPVIVSADGEPARLVERLGAGLASAANDSTGLAAAIRRLHAMDPAERQAYGTRALQGFRSEFTKAALVHRHEEIMSRMSRRSKHRAMPLDTGNSGAVAPQGGNRS